METIPPKPTILLEDEHVLVINKPSNFTVNKSETTIHEITVQDWVEKKFPISNFQFPISNESDFYKRAGIVHRLDKETSGILLIAKTPTAFEDLQRQFKERIVEKTYIALVHGILIPPEGEINVPVGRLGYNRKRFGIVAGGREAVTSYRTISNFKFPISNVKYGKTNETLSLLELYPKTGRTHQIRVHLKYLNHPIFSDMLYAGRKTARNDRKLLSRLFLHAAKISFNHPVTGERITVESSLPDELQSFLDKLSHKSVIRKLSESETQTV